MITKNYATLPNGQQTHYRRSEKAGHGSDGQHTTLVILHASPMSSETMLPIMHAIEGVCELLAPDTPGYGQSDPLSAKALAASATLAPYVAWLNEFINVLNLDKVAIYGSATGAQIAIEFARAYPDKTNFLVLDNAADFIDAERAEIMKNYFPDLSPREDGSHLQTIWKISASLFQWFPWYRQNDEHLVSSAKPPLAAVQATAKAYLLAGTDYAQAYRRAFINEDASRLQAVGVPTSVIRWQGSLIKKYADRFDHYQWPEHIQMCHCGKTFDERVSTIHQTILKHLETG